VTLCNHGVPTPSGGGGGGGGGFSCKCDKGWSGDNCTQRPPLPPPPPPLPPLPPPQCEATCKHGGHCVVVIAAAAAAAALPAAHAAANINATPPYSRCNCTGTGWAGSRCEALPPVWRLQQRLQQLLCVGITAVAVAPALWTVRWLEFGSSAKTLRSHLDSLPRPAYRDYGPARLGWLGLWSAVLGAADLAFALMLCTSLLGCGDGVLFGCALGSLLVTAAAGAAIVVATLRHGMQQQQQLAANCCQLVAAGLAILLSASHMPALALLRLGCRDCQRFCFPMPTRHYLFLRSGGRFQLVTKGLPHVAISAVVMWRQNTPYEYGNPPCALWAGTAALGSIGCAAAKLTALSLRGAARRCNPDTQPQQGPLDAAKARLAWAAASLLPRVGGRSSAFVLSPDLAETIGWLLHDLQLLPVVMTAERRMRERKAARDLELQQALLFSV
jgi:hypothetical protein